jgi:uncharacterized protein YjbI with pentapeptide repeats
MTRIFTEAEKRELAGRSFRDLALDGVDFAGADLRGAVFERVSLRGCDFRRADLRGAELLDCDLGGARFDEAVLGDNRFHGSRLVEITGLTDEQLDYVCRRGGGTVARQGPRLTLLE